MILRLLWISNTRTKSLIISKPFLYAKLNEGALDGAFKGSHKNGGLVVRLLEYGERKWHALAAYPSGSIRGRIYGLGSRLIDRIPMQERMLWRVYTYVSRPNDGFPGIEVGQAVLDASAGAGGELRELREMRELVKGALEHHRKWRLVHGMAVLPALCLSVLPFVKLWLAWEVFRTVTHHRAYVAARWLQDGLKASRFSKRAARPDFLVVGNSQLDDDSQGYGQIDEELPAILRKAFKE